MTYKASDIVKKAEQLADLTNTDFITWNEKISLLNDAYTMLYQKLVNIGDSSFVKPFIAYSGENILPPDFWQIKSVNLVQNKIVTPVKRRASSENYSSLSYEVRFDKLYINGQYTNGEIVVDYWAKPKTLTYKPKPVVLNPEMDGRTAIAVHDEKFFSTASSKLYWYDCKTETEKSVTLGANASLIVPCDDQCLAFTNNSTKVVWYDGTVHDTFADTVIPLITESGAIGFVSLTNDNIISINHHQITRFPYEINSNTSYIVCNDDLTDFYYLTSSRIKHNGDYVVSSYEMNENILATAIFYVNGNCWYYKSNEVGYVDSEENLHIVSMRPNCKGINKVDCNTGYGYTNLNSDGSYTVSPWVEDTVLDFPNSMYFTIMSYMLAIQFKIKQGADSSGLATVLQTLEYTFYDTLTQDANEYTRIKNVY